MRPERHDIAAPEAAPNTRWLNGEPKSMSALTAHGPVLVHFFDFAQLNCVRSLPYLVEWERRYRPLGLTTLGVHSPRHPFTAQEGALEPALRDLGISHSVADDSGYAIWHDYGCEGWPSLFLWGRGGVLRWFHFGEGEYEATERAIQDELPAGSDAVELPDPVLPMRATDAPGAVVAAPTPEVFPGGSPSEPWAGGAEELVLEYSAGGAYAAVSGTGALVVSVDGAAPHEAPVDRGGLVALAEHERHETHELAIRAAPGVDVWALSFAAGLP
jgi:hypothetical protein